MNEILCCAVSCWPFSAVAAVEGNNQIKKGKLMSLSEQELVDCDAEAIGCAGGYMSWALEFVMKNYGHASEVSYPYQGTNGACQTTKLNENTVNIVGCRNVTPKSQQRPGPPEGDRGTADGGKSRISSHLRLNFNRLTSWN